MNLLSNQGELFYRRLMSVVDDYGRFEADADKLRARCFPLQLDRWSPLLVEECLEECSELHGESRLITVYRSGNKKYLQINNFGQRVQSKEKYPSPDSPESTVVNGDPPSSRSRSRSRSFEVEDELKPLPSNTPILDASADLKPPATKTVVAKGSRFSLSELPLEWKEWSMSDRGWDEDHCQTTFAIFSDFWSSKTGRDATKLNWFATWRNWCRNERQQGTLAIANGTARESATDRSIRIGLERVERTGRL